MLITGVLPGYVITSPVVNQLSRMRDRMEKAGNDNNKYPYIPYSTPCLLQYILT